MYKVKLTGNEFLQITDIEHKRIKELWENPKMPGEATITLANGSTIQKKDIKGFRVDREEISKSKLAETRSNEEKERQTEYLADRSRKLRLSPEERGKEIAMIGMLYSAMTGKKDMPAELEELIVDEQTNFFKNNPKRTQCSPVEFTRDGYEKLKTLMPKPVKQMTGLMTATTVRMIESAVSQDKYYAR